MADTTPVTHTSSFHTISLGSVWHRMTLIRTSILADNLKHHHTCLNTCTKRALYIQARSIFEFIWIKYIFDLFK